MPYKKVKQHTDGHAVMCTDCGVPVLNQMIHERWHEESLARMIIRGKVNA